MPAKAKTIDEALGVTLPDGGTPVDDVTAPVVTDGTADTDIYQVFGYSVAVEDLDGTMVTIEKTYDQPRYATEILPGERGNLLVPAGDTVTDEVAASLSD